MKALAVIQPFPSETTYGCVGVVSPGKSGCQVVRRCGWVNASVDFPKERFADQLPERGLALHSGDFGLAEDFLGEIDSGFDRGIKTAIWFAVKS